MKGHGEKLSRKQEAAIAALLSHDTVKAAALACGVSEATLWRWMQLPEFQTRHRAARTSVVETAIGLMQQACTGAVATLVKVMRDETAPASARVGAARCVIEQSLRAVEVGDLQAEVEEIKRLLGEKEHARPQRTA